MEHQLVPKEDQSVKGLVCVWANHQFISLSVTVTPCSSGYIPLIYKLVRDPAYLWYK